MALDPILHGYRAPRTEKEAALERLEEKAFRHFANRYDATAYHWRSIAVRCRIQLMRLRGVYGQDIGARS